jgi:hypothetical protein
VKNNKIATLSQRLVKIANDYKATRTALLDEAKNAGIEPVALGRLATWMRKDELARLDQQAVDDQFRFHAGLRPTAAEMPRGGQLAMAASLYAEGKTVRSVADKMGVSVGKAHKLKMEAAAFNVQPQVNMNAPQDVGDGRSVPTPEANAAARREPKAEKEQPVVDDRPGNSGISTPPD